MNTLIANQYGRVQGEAGGCGLTLCVTAQTPRRESVEFQMRDGKAGESAEQQSPFDETICGEEDLFRSNGTASKNKIYGRFSQFLVYEQFDEGRLRVFFAVRDEAKRVARFDLHPGEVQALHALVRRALFACKQVDLLLRDDLSLSVAVNVSCHGLRFSVQ